MSTRTTAADPLTRPPVVLGLAAAATIAGAVGVALLATSTVLETPGQAALRTGALILAHILPALYLWWRHPASRFPALLLIVALSFGGYGLVGVAAEWPHYLGRLLTFVALPLAMYVFLAFPAGRLTGRASSIVVALLTTITVGGWLALGLVESTLPTTIPVFACGDACPSSPVSIADDPGLADDVTTALFVTASVVSVWGVALLALRLRRTPPAGRLAMALVTGATAITAGIAVAWLLNEAINGPDSAPPALMVAFALARFSLPVAITIAVLQDQGRSARALRSLLESMTPGSGVGDLRLALSRVLRDPDLVVARRAGDGWADLEGRPVPEPDGTRSWTEVTGADGRPTVALLHDPSLGETPEMVNAAASAAAIAVHQQDLADGLRRAVEDLRASRSRLATAADEERRRLERDLHDSAQQGLVALRVRVAVARETLNGDAASAAAALDEIDAELGAVLEDLRRLSRGLYPPLLEDRGLVDALRGAASRNPLPTTVDGEIGRLPRQIEVAAYFCCREALQNAAKHAGPDARVRVHLAVEEGALRFEVDDDGSGFDPVAASEGTGLTGMRDRAGAVGGRLEVHSSPGGTAVRGVLPLDAAD